MKYMLLFIRSEDDGGGDDPSAETSLAIGRWFGDLEAQDCLRGAERLQPARTATTVRWSDGEPLVTDGPFVESKETVAGFATVEVTNLDEAIAIAKRWPNQVNAVEIRPVVAVEDLPHGPVG